MIPFSTSTQFTNWTVANCGDCIKSDNCDINETLSLAYIGDGEVSDDIAERMGATYWHNCYLWPCKERRGEDGERWGEYSGIKEAV